MHKRFVWNKKAPEWGSGVVLREWNDGAAKKTEVLFLDAGRKKLLNSAALLEDLHSDEVPESSPLRDAGKWREIETRKAFQAQFDTMVARFRRVFPLGFLDPNFGPWERDYKLRAVTFAQEEFAADRLAALFAEERHDRVFEVVLAAVAKTNLIHPRWERSKLAALDAGARREVAAGLFEFLHGDAPYPERLERFGSILGEYGVGKWTIASYLGFIYAPEERPFVKPQAVQYAANALHRDLHYDSRPNARTYEAVIRLHTDVRAELGKVGLEPRDMIDVQTFLWVGSSMGYEQI